jgi:hypothetical protein
MKSFRQSVTLRAMKANQVEGFQIWNLCGDPKEDRLYEPSNAASPLERMNHPINLRQPMRWEVQCCDDNETMWFRNLHQAKNWIITYGDPEWVSDSERVACDARSLW